MLRYKDSDDIFPSPCQIVPSISQDYGQYTFCTPSSLMNYDNYFGPSPIYLMHQGELESVQVADIEQDGYTPPQSHTQDADITSTTNYRSNQIYLERSQVEIPDTQLTITNDSLFTSVISTPRNADYQDGDDMETILDILCSEEERFDEFIYQGELRKGEFSENKSQTIDSEKCLGDGDIFVNGEDDLTLSDEVDWLENL